VRIRALFLIAAALALGAPAWADDVVSARPDKVEVTVYRDRPMTAAMLAEQDGDEGGLALITETRVVDVPAGRTRIRFEGVADGIIPQSATLEGLPAGVAERNFDYALLSPGSLIAHSIGQLIHVVRTDRKTGRSTTDDATVRSGPNGLVLQTREGVEAFDCSGAPERLVFDRAPEGLADRPTLSIITDAAKPGRYSVRLSYLSVRLNWGADYVARISPDGTHLDLTGWITLANHTGQSFTDAPTAVVAGKLERQPVDLPTIVPTPFAPACWSTANGHHGVAVRRRGNFQTVPMAVTAFTARQRDAVPMDKDTEVGAVIVTAEKREARLSELGEYKVYTLPEPTTVAARQTKQVLFLNQTNVAFTTVYVFRTDFHTDDDPPTPEPANQTLRFDNTPANGLGKPLPLGLVSLRQQQGEAGSGELFIGARSVRDVAVGEPFELTLGSAQDVTVRETRTSQKTVGFFHKRVRTALAMTAVNDKAAPVVVELRHARRGANGFRVVEESQPHALKSGDPIWRVELQPGESKDVTFTVEADE
jgi:hypothetical protein